jgi:RNA polymerase sigma-70 factor, ECF subfamily
MELKDQCASPTEEQAETQMTQLLLHLDAAHSLARCLTRNELDAEDVVQEAYLRAFSYLATFRGGDGRAWLLAIVRNSYYSRLRRNRVHEPMDPFDEKFHGVSRDAANPETLIVDQQEKSILRGALDDLPAPHREVLLLREMEDLSYQEIANKVGVPIGTVMSRLSRARKRLHRDLLRQEASASRGTRGPIDCDGGKQVLAGCVGVGI